MKSLKSLFIIPLLALLLSAVSSFAFDGDMDEYHEFKEDLSLARDTYVQAMNMVAEDAPEKLGGGWAAIEFEPPETAYVKLEEMQGGFKIKGSHGAYKLDAEVKFSIREGDNVYEVKFLKGTNKPGKEIAGEVFR